MKCALCGTGIACRPLWASLRWWEENWQFPNAKLCGDQVWLPKLAAKFSSFSGNETQLMGWQCSTSQRSRVVKHAYDCCCMHQGSRAINHTRPMWWQHFMQRHKKPIRHACDCCWMHQGTNVDQDATHGMTALRTDSAYKIKSNKWTAHIENSVEN